MNNTSLLNIESYASILFVDVETSGMAFSDGDPSVDFQNHSLFQPVSIGAIATDRNLNELGSFYSTIGFNPKNTWTRKAEQVHGITLAELERGPTYEEAAIAFVTFLHQHFNLSESIILGGHNVFGFDRFFINRWLKDTEKIWNNDIAKPRFKHRSIDSATVGLLSGFDDSDALFAATGAERSAHHNALDDVKMSLHVARITQDALISAGFYFKQE